MARDDRRLRRGLEHLGEGPLGRMREVEDHSQRGEPADEPSAEAGQTAVGGLAEAVRERVATVPGERHHAHAELPEDVRDPWVVAQRLDAFEREHDPDSAVEGVQIVCRPNDHHVVRTLACRAVERLHLRERAAQGELGEVFELDKDRAHLHPDAARAQLRQPVRRERLLLVGAKRQLEEQVVVCVDDHPRRSRCRVLVNRSVLGEDDAEDFTGLLCAHEFVADVPRDLIRISLPRIAPAAAAGAQHADPNAGLERAEVRHPLGQP